MLRKGDDSSAEVSGGFRWKERRKRAREGEEGLGARGEKEEGRASWTYYAYPAPPARVSMMPSMFVGYERKRRIAGGGVEYEGREGERRGEERGGRRDER